MNKDLEYLKELGYFLLIFVVILALFFQFDQYFNWPLNIILLLWIIGFTFSLILGHIIVFVFKRDIEKIAIKRLREQYYNNPIYSYRERSRTLDELSTNEENFKIKDVAYIGHLERFFFTLLTALSYTNSPVLIFVWIGVKIVRNWQVTKEEKTHVSVVFAMCSLSSNLLSMILAFIGGLICHLWKLNEF